MLHRVVQEGMPPFSTVVSRRNVTLKTTSSKFLPEYQGQRGDVFVVALDSWH